MTGFDVRVLCSRPAAAGFRLAGIVPMEVDDVPDGVRRLLAAPDMAGLGVLLVEDSFYHALPPLARRTMARRPLPMVVPFPGPAWSALPEAPESFIAELLRQAIGYRVRLA